MFISARIAAQLICKLDFFLKKRGTWKQFEQNRDEELWDNYKCSVNEQYEKGCENISNYVKCKCAADAIYRLKSGQVNYQKDKIKRKHKQLDYAQKTVQLILYYYYVGNKSDLCQISLSRIRVRSSSLEFVPSSFSNNNIDK